MPVLSCPIYFPHCLTFVSNPVANDVITILVDVVMSCVFFIMRRVEADVEIGQGHIKAKDIFVPFFAPSIFG